MFDRLVSTHPIKSSKKRKHSFNTFLQINLPFLFVDEYVVLQTCYFIGYIKLNFSKNYLFFLDDVEEQISYSKVICESV
jgi:hypothetical protein